MRVSLQWLRELVPFRSDVDSLAEQLSMAGFEVEEQEDLAARAAGVDLPKRDCSDSRPRSRARLLEPSLASHRPALMVSFSFANVPPGRTTEASKKFVDKALCC